MHIDLHNDYNICFIFYIYSQRLAEYIFTSIRSIELNKMSYNNVCFKNIHNNLMIIHTNIYTNITMNIFNKNIKHTVFFSSHSMDHNLQN